MNSSYYLKNKAKQDGHGLIKGINGGSHTGNKDTNFSTYILSFLLDCPCHAHSGGGGGTATYPIATFEYQLLRPNSDLEPAGSAIRARPGNELSSLATCTQVFPVKWITYHW